VSRGHGSGRNVSTVRVRRCVTAATKVGPDSSTQNLGDQLIAGRAIADIALSVRDVGPAPVRHHITKVTSNAQAARHNQAAWRKSLGSKWAVLGSNQ
jgi:hypothetical protein